MDPVALIIFLAIGLVAGWLAGQIMKGRGFGLVGNLVVGVVGAFLGGIIAGAVGLANSGLVMQIVVATAGAVLLLAIIGFIKKQA